MIVSEQVDVIMALGLAAFCLLSYVIFLHVEIEELQEDLEVVTGRLSDLMDAQEAHDEISAITRATTSRLMAEAVRASERVSS
jgi:hypothetical protein